MDESLSSLTHSLGEKNQELCGLSPFCLRLDYPPCRGGFGIGSKSTRNQRSRKPATDRPKKPYSDFPPNAQRQRGLAEEDSRRGSLPRQMGTPRQRKAGADRMRRLERCPGTLQGQGR